MNYYNAWCDDSCDVNPGGTAKYGVIVKGKSGTVLLEQCCVVGTGKVMSNNVAEYAALIHVLQYLLPRSPGHVVIHGDSRLVINQLNGEWRVRDALLAYCKQDTLAMVRLMQVLRKA